MAIPGGFQFHSALPNQSNFDEVFAQSCHMVRNQLDRDAIEKLAGKVVRKNASQVRCSVM